MVETFSNMKALFQQDDYEEDERDRSREATEIRAAGGGQVGGREEQRPKEMMLGRQVLQNKKNTLETTTRGQQISPPPSDRHNERSLRLAARGLPSDTFDGVTQLHIANDNDRSLLVDQPNDHGENSSVQTFSDIVSKQNQIQSKLQGDKDAAGHVNVETLPKINKESIINIDQLINASRLQTRESFNGGPEDL